VSGATGRSAPETLKVSATYRAGWSASGTFTIYGRDAVAKARRCGDVVRARLNRAGFEPRRYHVECLGAGQLASADQQHPQTLETVLRISVADDRRDVVERFSRELMPLVTAGPQGLTGYSAGRPRVREVFGYWPCLIDRREVAPCMEMIEV
jgi:hypothetical protein